MRHDDGRGEEHQQQGAPWPLLQRGVQRGQGCLVLQQPDFQLMGTTEHAVQRVQADTAQRQQLDHRFEGDGEHQAFVLLTGGDVARAKENREQADQHAEGECHPCLDRFAGEDADRVGHRLDLQGQQWQYPDQHDDRGQRAGPGTAKAKRQQVGQRGKLVGAGDLEDRVEQHRRQQERAGHPQITGKEAVAVLVGQAHRAIEGPGTGVHAQRQGVGERVANDRARDQPPLADPGHAEQHHEVRGADQDHLGQAKAHRHLVGSAG
ncbi:hypothetical protein D3C79_483080 [compost metagenome]